MDLEVAGCVPPDLDLADFSVPSTKIQAAGMDNQLRRESLR